MFIFFSILLFGWGCWSIYALIKGKRSQFLTMPNDEIIPKKILGKSYDRVTNLTFGTICLIGGIVAILYYTAII